MRERGFVVTGARILRRAWQIYVAHVFLFVIFVAEIAYVARGFENPLFAEEMGFARSKPPRDRQAYHIELS
jgi:OpgC protein